MSFKDIFKKSFLEGYAGNDITTATIIIALAIASALALYIFLVYSLMTRKTFYSKNFNISLAGVTVITAAIILTMQSSIVLSLGMVGALSIVRFRTAIKDPMDLMFLFWSISVGIICGAGLSQVAIILSLVVTVGIFVLNHLPMVKTPMLLVVNSTKTDIMEDVQNAVSEFSKYYKVKSRNMTAMSLDMVIELRTTQGDDLIKKVMGIDGVVSASLLSHDGETTF